MRRSVLFGLAVGFAASAVAAVVAGHGTWAAVLAAVALVVIVVLATPPAPRRDGTELRESRSAAGWVSSAAKLVRRNAEVQRRHGGPSDPPR